jgi:hypothetical protein
MKKTHQKQIRISTLLVAFGFIAANAFMFMPMNQVSAAQITERSLTLEAGASDGGSAPGGVVNHFFEFTLPGGTNVGSILFEYCTTAAGTTCTTPAGLDTTGASLSAETGVTGFSLNNTTNGAPYLTRTSAAVGAGVDVTYRLNTITNPTAVNETFFVRIATYASIDTTGLSEDTGTVTASTAEPIIVSGTMPESLVFCTGEEVLTTTGVPDCSTATAGSIEFDQLFSPTDTASTQSQMAASTNAGFGYVITVNGTTLTSGANEIDGMATATTGVRGTAQFGLNLVENTVTTTTVPRGIAVAPIADGVDYKGEPATDYATADTFKFLSGDVIANSFNGGAGGTDAQIFTVSYIVNVPGNQPAGTYSSTLTYICTPTY